MTQNDINMLDYLGKQIQLYCTNKLWQNISDNPINNNVLTLDNISNSDLNNTSLNDIYKYFYTFYTTIPTTPDTKPTSVSADISYFNGPPIGPPKSNPFSGIYYKCNQSTNYRLIICDNTGVVEYINLKYDNSYLSKGQSYYLDSYPNNNRSPINILSTIAPKIYLELCTNYVNNFFVNLFRYNVGEANVLFSGQTESTINDFCNQQPNYTSQACYMDKSNIRCGCQDCFSDHSFQSRQIAQYMLDANVIPSDNWCLYPKCASGMALKNVLGQQRSVCSNISVAGIFLEPNDNSSINITNTSVTASSSNDAGINIIGKGCGDCTSSQKCGIVNNSLTCVNNDLSNKQFNYKKDIEKINYKGDNSSNKSKLSLLIIIFSIVIIILVILRFVYKTNKRICFLIELGILLSIIIFSILLVYNLTKKESFISYPSSVVSSLSCTKDNVCYQDSDCTIITNSKCSNNECSCPIGMFLTSDKTCIDFPIDTSKSPSPLGVVNCIITNLPYLPESLFTTGLCYYSTIINNVIYVFCQNCNFKFDGIKWVEISSIKGQVGFMIFKPPINLRYNTNMIQVYNNNIYIFLDQNSMLYSCLGFGSTDYKILHYIIYDTKYDQWTFHQIKTTDIDQLSNTNSTMIIKDNIMYIFFSGKKSDNIYKNYIVSVNLNTDIGIINNSTMLLTYDSYVFLYNNFIYLTNLESTPNTLTNFNIYTYDITSITFKILKSFDIILNKDQIITQNRYLYSIMTNELHIVSFINTNIINLDTLINVPLKYTIVTVIPFCCSFIINNYIFIITPSGEIFRYFYTNNTIYINPCYGITNYDMPISSRILQV